MLPYRISIDKDIPVIMPRLRIRAFTLPEIPSILRGAFDIISDVFGDWNIPLPMDIMVTKMINRYKGENSFKEDIR
jgi:hypothetical protein